MKKIVYQEIRKSWKMNPVEKKIESKKRYNRKNKDWRKEWY